MPEGYRTCRICGKELVMGERWQAASVEQRAQFKADGKARGVRVDMCANDRERLNRSGELAKYEAASRRGPHSVVIPPAASGPCVRCGQPEVSVGQLCRDCADVTLDLNERAGWGIVSLTERDDQESQDEQHQDGERDRGAGLHCLVAGGRG